MAMWSKVMGTKDVKPIVITGHQEMDSQHHDLEELIRKLGTVCELRTTTGANCVECPPDCRTSCADKLADLLADLLGFIVAHFAYEESLMRRLPSTQECIRHIEEHKLAHADVSSQLAELAARMMHEEPRQCGLRLEQIISSWMGVHEGSFDVQLARELENIDDTELAYDVKLARLLEQAAAL